MKLATIPTMIRMLAVLPCLTSCTALLPEWSNNASVKHAEEHRRANPGHVELPLTLLWNERRQPVAPLLMVVVTLTVASLCMLGLALEAVRRTLLAELTEGPIDGKAAAAPTPDVSLAACTAETVPLSPRLRPTELHPAKSHVVVISACPKPLRLPPPHI